MIRARVMVLSLPLVACGDSVHTSAPPTTPAPLVVTAPSAMPSAMPSASAPPPAAHRELVVAVDGEHRYFEGELIASTELDAVVELEWSTGQKQRRTLPRSSVWPIHTKEPLSIKAGEYLLCRVASREWKACVVTLVHDGFGVFDVLDGFFKTVESKRFEFASVVRPSAGAQDSIAELHQQILRNRARETESAAFEQSAKKMVSVRPSHWKPSVGTDVMVHVIWGWVPARVTKVQGSKLFVALASGGTEWLDNDAVGPMPSKRTPLSMGMVVAYRTKAREKNAPWDWVWPFAKVIAIKGDSVELNDKEGEVVTATRGDLFPLEP